MIGSEGCTQRGGPAQVNTSGFLSGEGVHDSSHGAWRKRVVRKAMAKEDEGNERTGGKQKQRGETFL